MAKKKKADEPAEVIEKDLEKVLEAESDADAKEKSEAAPEKPKIDYGSPEQLAIYDAETQDRVNAMADEVAVAEEEYEQLKGEASEAKKDLEVKEKRLRTLIKERHDRRGKPPIAETGNLFAGAVGVEERSDVWPPENLWEQFPLDRFTEFGLTAGDVAKFAAGDMKDGKEGIGPIDTMGAMSRFTAPAANGWARKLTDIKGVGQATLDRYSEAETKFWEAWKNGGLAEKFAEERGIKKPEPADATESEATGGSGGTGDEAADGQAAEPERAQAA